MLTLAENPVSFFALSALLLFAAERLGTFLRANIPALNDADNQETFKVLQASVIGLLGLLLGFTFSMSVSRYEQRRDLQLQEANSIGTTWLRTSLLPQPQRSASQQLLQSYVDVRVHFFTAGNNAAQLDGVQQQTSSLQGKLWSIAASTEQRDAFTGQYIVSLNETIDLAEKRQSALENRIPWSAWALLLFIGMVASGLLGVSVRTKGWFLPLVLPVVVACAFALVVDLDSPRSGFIHVDQRSMQRLQQSLHAQQ